MFHFFKKESAALLRAHPRSRGVEQGFRHQAGGAAVADDFDFEARIFAGVLFFDVGEGEGFADPVGVAAGGDPADRPAVVADGFVADDVEAGVVDDEGDEAEFAAFLFFPEGGVAADEVAFFEADEAAESGFIGAVDRAVFARPGAPGFLQAQAVHRPCAGEFEAEPGAGVGQAVVEGPGSRG